MRRLRFIAPAKHTLEPEPGEVVYGGGEFTCSDERAEEHLTSPHYNCVEVGEATVTLGDDEVKRELLKGYTRPELNDIATEAGVPDPESLRNREAVAEAIAAVAIEEESEAADGEGPADEPEAGDGEGLTYNPEIQED